MTIYYVRVSVEVEGGGVNEYNAAFELAEHISRQVPGLTVEIMQDKVWGTITTGG